MDLWNEIELSLPPNSSCTMSRKKIGEKFSTVIFLQLLLTRDHVLDINNFIRSVQDSIDTLKNTERFHNEAAQLSRLIFMNCKQFRMMKGLHEMKKAQQSLRRYLNMDLVSVIETFKGFISEESGSTVTVPYQQNLDYILIRFQGLSKLFLRVVESTRRSANYFLGLIKAGSFYTKGVVFLSTLASVWSLSRSLCKSVVEQYNKLRVFRERLTAKPEFKWVDGDYELPEKLEEWLGDEYLNHVINETYDVRLLIKDADVEAFLERKNDGVFDRMKESYEATTLKEVMIEQDIDLKINVKDELELEDFAPISRTSRETPQKTIEVEHSRSSLLSKASVSNFIKKENNYRKVDPQKSLTISKMKKKVWKEFKDDIKNKTILMQESVFLDYVKDYLDEYKV